MLNRSFRTIVLVVIYSMVVSQCHSKANPFVTYFDKYIVDTCYVNDSSPVYPSCCQSPEFEIPSIDVLDDVNGAYSWVDSFYSTYPSDNSDQRSFGQDVDLCTYLDSELYTNLTKPLMVRVEQRLTYKEQSRRTLYGISSMCYYHAFPTYVLVLVHQENVQISARIKDSVTVTVVNRKCSRDLSTVTLIVATKGADGHPCLYYKYQGCCQYQNSISIAPTALNGDLVSSTSPDSDNELRG